MKKYLLIFLLPTFIFLSGCSNGETAQTRSTAMETMNTEANKIQEASNSKTTKEKAGPMVNKKETFYDLSYTISSNYILLDNLSDENEKAYMMSSGCYIYVYRDAMQNDYSYMLDRLSDDRKMHEGEDYHHESNIIDASFNGLEGGYFFAGVFNDNGSYTLYIHNCIPINGYCYSILYQENNYNDDNTENVKAFYKVLNTVEQN